MHIIATLFRYFTVKCRCPYYKEQKRTKKCALMFAVALSKCLACIWSGEEKLYFGFVYTSPHLTSPHLFVSLFISDFFFSSFADEFSYATLVVASRSRIFEFGIANTRAQLSDWMSVK